VRLHAFKTISEYFPASNPGPNLLIAGALVNAAGVELFVSKKVAKLNPLRERNEAYLPGPLSSFRFPQTMEQEVEDGGDV